MRESWLESTCGAKAFPDLRLPWWRGDGSNPKGPLRVPLRVLWGLG